MQTIEPQKLSIWQQPVRPAMLVLLVLLVVIGYILWPHLTKLPIMDENIMIYEGFSVARGQLPYRDFFDFIWPGTFYLVAAISKIFGPSLFALRMFVLLCLCTCGFITLKIGQSFLSLKWLLLLAGLFYLFNIPSAVQVGHHLFSTTAALLSVWQLFQYVSCSFTSNEQKLHLKLAGLFCGLTFCFTQSMGLCLILASLLFLGIYLSRSTQKFSKKVQSLTLFSGFAIGPILLTVAWLMLMKAGPDFFYSTFGWLFEGGYRQTTDSWYFKDGFLKMMEGDGLKTVTLFLEGMLPILGLLWPLDIFYRNRIRNTKYRPADWKLLLLWLASLAFMLPIFSYPTSMMIAYHAWLPYLLAAIILFTWLKNKPYLEKTVIFGVLVLVCIHLGQQLQTSTGLMQSKKLISYGTVEKELFPTMATADEVTSVYNKLTYWIHEHTRPGEELFVYNLAPELYILTDRQNPTRYNYLLAVYNTPRQIQEAADSLETKRPKYIVYNHLDWFFFTKDSRFSRLRHVDYHLKPIERLLDRHYQLRVKAGALWLYEYTQ